MLQIEKDMIHDFYHNTREEIRELEARVTNYDTKMQEAEARHRTDIISHMQKVKHLEYEHVNSCDQVKADAMGAMKEERTHHTGTESDNLLQKAERKEAYGINDKANIAEVEEREVALQYKVQELQLELDGQKKDLIDSYELKLRRLEDELDLRMKVEIHEIEERKNEHINELMQAHETAFTEMKKYFNDITKENLELIKQHKEKLSELKTSTTSNEKILHDLKEEVHLLKAPLQAAMSEEGKLRDQVATFEKDTMALRNARGYLKDLKAKTKQLKDDRDMLDEKFKRVTAEKNDMYAKFETVIAQLRQKANYKNYMLEQKLATFQRDYDKKELDLRELIQRSGLDTGTIEEICKKMEEAIEAKNSILRNLKYSLAHATKAYNDAIRVYEAKLVEFGIPADELGLEQLPTNTSKMPAGLVAA